MSQLKKLATQEGLSVGEWVRRALRKAYSDVPVVKPSKKMEAIDRAFEHCFPISDIEEP